MPGCGQPQRITTLFRTVTCVPEKAGILARRMVDAMHPPVRVPAKGGPLRLALVTRPDGAKVTMTMAVPLGSPSCRQPAACPTPAFNAASAASLLNGGESGFAGMGSGLGADGASGFGAGGVSGAVSFTAGSSLAACGRGCAGPGDAGSLGGAATRGALDSAAVGSTAEGAGGSGARGVGSGTGTGSAVAAGGDTEGSTGTAVVVADCCICRENRKYASAAIPSSTTTRPGVNQLRCSGTSLGSARSDWVAFFARSLGAALEARSELALRCELELRSDAPAEAWLGGGLERPALSCLPFLLAGAVEARACIGAVGASSGSKGCSTLVGLVPFRSLMSMLGGPSTGSSVPPREERNTAGPFGVGWSFLTWVAKSRSAGVPEDGITSSSAMSLKSRSRVTARRGALSGGFGTAFPPLR